MLFQTSQWLPSSEKLLGHRVDSSNDIRASGTPLFGLKH
jgi:hypothetical protein